jgi:hypothetical protein
MTDLQSLRMAVDMMGRFVLRAGLCEETWLQRMDGFAQAQPLSFRVGSLAQTRIATLRNGVSTHTGSLSVDCPPKTCNP